MLGVIIVGYRNKNEIVEYISSQLSKVDLPKKVVVVDNSNDDELTRSLADDLGVEAFSDYERKYSREKLLRDVFIINAKGNIGFAKGNNAGALFLKKNFPVIDFYLFSNTDIVIPSGKIIELLITKYKSIENVGAIGPKIIGLDGIDQSPHRYISFYERYVAGLLLRPFIKWIKHGYSFTDILDNQEEGVYYRLMGCFLLIDKDLFHEVGMFDDSTFMYCEEKILSERLKRKDRVCYYTPDYYIVHKESVTTAKEFSRLKKSLLILKSDIIYYSKYKSNIKLFLYLGYICVLWNHFVIQKIRKVKFRIKNV